MRLAGIAVLALAIAGCTEVTEAVDSTARAGAKGVVTETLATRFPQVPKKLITPFTDCIIDYADALEVREFARAAVVGVDDSTVTIVRNILARPDTQTCLKARTLEAGLS
ncbi:hypothetical protein O4H53_06195 [Sulfitobacter sp. G21635-S1]|jgi:hypothetical protein|uniref:hypothetical protein n=1 Tax=Sulfitobacter sp. G21635-S1 TaxID=3014043 RepID=UPI000DF492CD|nr:hypothetical protein [Sulfitobacter sp. G21635-S1]MCZ4255120.1 hypothetical protein [Sulfitobacter sp. G21635-S1]